MAATAHVAAEALAVSAPRAAHGRDDQLAAAAQESRRDRLGQPRALLCRDFEAIDH